MKCLIIKKEHLDKILDGSKTWEMRSRKTNVRGLIGLIESGSGLIVGECYLWGCSEHPLNFVGAQYHQDKHCVDDLSKLEKWCYAWKLKAAKRYEKPIPYKHPKGAVIWVNVEEKP